MTKKQEHQRVAVGPKNAHFISIRQVSSDTATLQRRACGYAAQWPMRPHFYAVVAAALLLMVLLCIGNYDDKKLIIIN